MATASASSGGFTRNMNSFPPVPDALVMSGEVDVSTTSGTWSRLAIGMAASVTPLHNAPTRTAAFSWVMSLVTEETPSVGLQALSSALTASFLPP